MIAEKAIVYDDNGQHQAVSCVEYMARNGASVELITPDRSVAFEVGDTNYPIYLKTFYEFGVGMTVNHRLVNVETNNGVLQATFFNEFNHSTVVREAQQIVVEHGTLPNDELYFSLKERSLNLGITDYDALAENRPQTAVSNHRGEFQLFRVGDAVASRNIHAAIYDSLRICKDI